MKKIIVFLLTFLGMADDSFLMEIQHAFLRFDANNNGIVTKEEIFNAVVEDIGTDQSPLEMKEVIEKMVMEYDLDANGFDFA